MAGEVTMGVEMAHSKLKEQLTLIRESQLGKSITRQLSGYENTLSSMVKDFETRGRDARDKSWKRIQALGKDLNRRRGSLENTVGKLLNEEAKRLNRRVSDLLTYLKSVANSEKLAVRSNGAPERIPRARPRASSTTTRKRRSTRKKH